MRAALLIALGALAALGCKKHESVPIATEREPAGSAAPSLSTERVKPIIDQLQSSEADERKKGLAALHELDAAKDLTVAEGLALLAAAGEPISRNEAFDASTQLVGPLVTAPRKEFLDALKRFVANDKTTDDARAHAIVAIAAIDSPFAAAELLRDLRKYGEHLGYRMPLSILEGAPHQAEVLFPRLFDLADVPGFETDVYSVAIAYCTAKQLDAAKLKDATPRIVGAYRTAAAALGARARPAKDGDDDDKFLAARYHAAELIRLLGCLDHGTVALDLAGAELHPDERIRMVAALAFVEGGGQVDPVLLDEIAANPELRGTLYTQLGKLSHPELFPAKYAEQGLLAESDLASWLAFSDTNRAPDQIQLVKKLSRVDPETVKDVDYYVYRYRLSTVQNGAWLAGIAGPFPRGTLTVDGDATTSDFEPWAGHTPEQHLKRMLDDQ